jgi:hypothetical protein
LKWRRGFSLAGFYTQWSKTRKSEDTDKKQNYWLEPANEKLINADNLFNGENLPVIIKGAYNTQNNNNNNNNNNTAQIDINNLSLLQTHPNGIKVCKKYTIYPAYKM